MSVCSQLHIVCARLDAHEADGAQPKHNGQGGVRLEANREHATQTWRSPLFSATGGEVACVTDEAG